MLGHTRDDGPGYTTRALHALHVLVYDLLCGQVQTVGGSPYLLAPNPQQTVIKMGQGGEAPSTN